MHPKTPIGKTMTGNDGRKWIVKKMSNNVKRWVLVNSRSKNKSPSKKSTDISIEKLKTIANKIWCSRKWIEESNGYNIMASKWMYNDR